MCRHKGRFRPGSLVVMGNQHPGTSHNPQLPHCLASMDRVVYRLKGKGRTDRPLLMPVAGSRSPSRFVRPAHIRELQFSQASPCDNTRQNTSDENCTPTTLHQNRADAVRVGCKNSSDRHAFPIDLPTDATSRCNSSGNRYDVAHARNSRDLGSFGVH